MTNEAFDIKEENYRYLRDRVEELEVQLEVLRAELRIAQQELWKKEPQ